MWMPERWRQELSQCRHALQTEEGEIILARGQCEVLLMMDRKGRVQGLFSLDNISWDAREEIAPQPGTFTRLSRAVRNLLRSARDGMFHAGRVHGS